MAIITGVGQGPSAIQAVFAQPFLLTLSSDGTTITASNSLGTVTIGGSGFAYTSFVQSGTTYYQLTSGTINRISYLNGSNQQNWFGLNVSAVDASNDLLSSSAFNNLFFSSDDTFTWQAFPSTTSVLFGLGGNDTFNIHDWDNSGSGNGYDIDGGSGTNTLNVVGGIGTNFSSAYNADLSSGNLSNFNVTNVQTINLTGPIFFTIFASASLDPAGSTVTVDGSALGAMAPLIFNTNLNGGTNVIAGNLVLLGGAGNDVLEGSTGNTIYNGGGGNNTVDFYWGQQRGLSTGVTADLSNTGTQNFGTGYGTGTFINIQNLIGTRGNDTLTGDTNDNVFTGEGGNDTITGGGGFDVAVFANPYASYTITHSSTTTATIAGPDGTTTLNGVEEVQFSDRSIQLYGPQVTTSNLRLAAGQSIPVQDHDVGNGMIGGGLFAALDTQGDAITEYQLWDGSSDPNSGYFVINGVRQPAHTIITISAAQMSQLSQVTFVGGSADTSLQIRAFDGTAWSAGDSQAWDQFTVGPDVEHAPMVATDNTGLSPNQNVPLTSLFSVFDADGDAITEYQLWDSSSAPGSGYFTINGVAQPAHTIITITPAQLAQTDFFAGTASASLQIRAYDGMEWSAADNAAWAPFTVTVPTDSPPIVASHDYIVSPGQALALQSLVAVTDPDGDAITQYQLWDSTRDPNAGYWAINGIAQPAGTIITITAAQAAQTTFVTGSVATSLQVRASDGILWSAADNASWAPFMVSPPQDVPPTVETDNVTAVPGQTFTLGNLAVYIGNNPATEYQLWDSTRDPNAGHWVVNGVTQPAGTVITITATQASQTTFVAGSVATSLQVRASDGILWSAADNANWAPFAVAPPPPVVTTTDVTEAAGQTLALSSLFSVSDPNGLPITKYELWDSTSNPGAGYFTVNGVAQPSHTIIDITAAQLSQTSFVTGSVLTSLQIRANDGLGWSAADNASWAPFTVNPGRPPIVGTSNITLPHGGYSTPLAGLISVVDPDGRAITEYQLWDSNRDPSSGYFTVNGVVQPAGTVIDITASQLTQTNYVTGLEGDQLQVRAFDGVNWSAPANGDWSPFTTSVSDTPPVVTTSDVNASANQSLALSSLFTVTDADSDTMTKYELWQSTRDPNAGHFVVDGTTEAAGTVIDVTAAQLAQTSFLTGTIGAALQIRAFDGISWSAADNANWAPFHVNVS